MSDEDACNDGDCSSGTMCFKHKIRTIQWSPACTPTRRNNIPPRAPSNSWEKGIATDDRGMPLLGKGGSPIGLKERASRRGEIDSHLRDLRNAPRTPTPPK